MSLTTAGVCPGRSRVVCGVVARALILYACASAAAAAHDWPSYNRTPTGERFSALKQINTSNVSELRVLCTYDTGVKTSFQSGLIEVRGVIYGTTEMDTFALDASDCAQKWRVHEDYTPASNLHVNRGAAYLDGRLYRGTEDGRVLAYDAGTGRRLWAVQIADPTHSETVPAAPLAWNGMVFVGNAGGDNKGVKGRIYALDARSGRILWVFYMVPKDREQAFALGWFNAPDAPITGGATWTTYTLDPESRLLYVPGGNAAPDFDKSLRGGDNLFTNSVVALDSRTGKLSAHYAVTPADFHDWDESTAPALITTKSGKQLLAVSAKDGFLHGFELRSRHEVYKTPVTEIQNEDVPLSPMPVHFCPGTQGGSEWNGPAYDPQQNLIFTGAVQWCETVALAPSAQTLSTPLFTPWTGNSDPQHAFGTFDPMSSWAGWIYATDADTGVVVWKRKMPFPVLSGVTPTAGGLVLVGDIGGTQYALDAATGSVLWSGNLGGAIGGGVITYDHRGSQRIAVALGMTSSIWPTQQTTAKVSILALSDGAASH